MNPFLEKALFMSDSNTNFFDTLINKLKNHKVAASIAVLGIILAGTVTGVTNLKTVVAWLRPTPKLSLYFEVTNKSGHQLDLMPWCEISVYEEHDGVHTSYPDWSRPLSMAKGSNGEDIVIPPHKSVKLKTVVLIDDSYSEVYKRASGKIQFSFQTTNRKHSLDSAWRFSEELGGVGPLRVKYEEPEEKQQVSPN